ncbi:hypothetical protein LO772_16575 [Yinghuangia sp. ASG 101]|uniref:hypothetical protein n=1 Tax=Yinghuangia sp. ASG 101 TaxID=2896848 RepID=UPI001E4A109F|nr:hypothetical protein [Yinghuangia sp. ASG 101]UGQ15033.1 hypothetical protein LO772_16575 [Yinghuangia sp. ASG 101]
MIFRLRCRYWDYSGGVTVEVPVDEPDAVPPRRLEDVPAHWRRWVRGVPVPQADK